MKVTSSNDHNFLFHLEALRWHLMRSLFAIVLGSIVVFLNKAFVFDNIIFACKENTFPTYIFLCNLSDRLCIQDMPFILMNVEMAGQFTMHLLISFVGGFILVFPYILYEIWLFVSPAMYKQEKITSILFFIMTCFLFLVGILFGYYIIIPFSINFLSSYMISDVIENNIHFISFIKTIATIILTTGFIFQLPLVIYILTRFNFINTNQLRQYRKHSFVIILLVASVLTPPDVFSQILIGLPVFLLYELSIFVSLLTSRKNEINSKELKKEI